MPRRTTPCNRCGKLMYQGNGTPPPGQMRCQPCRREESQPYKPSLPPKPCKNCTAEFIPANHTQRYCSPPCRPRGRQMVPCEVCGTPFEKIGPQRTCGRECGKVISRRPRKPTPPKRYRLKVGGLQDKPVRFGPIAICDCGMVALRPKVEGKGQRSDTCPACQDKVKRLARGQHKRTRRARKLAAYSEPYDLITDIYDRDDWVCQLCFEPIDRDAVAPSDWSVSHDHIVPLSRGGDDTRENVQTAHFWCNSVKGDREDFAWRTSQAPV